MEEVCDFRANFLISLKYTFVVTIFAKTRVVGKSCLAASFVVLDNNQNKRNNFESESRRLQVKVGATNFAEKNHMIKNSVKNLSHFISLKTLDIWNIELQRNQLLKLSCVIIVCKMTILWQQIIDKKVKTPLSSFLSSLGLKSRSTAHTQQYSLNFFENEFLCPSTKLQDIPLLLPFSQSGDIFKDWRARPPTCQCLHGTCTQKKSLKLMVIF